jgi:hypothetical protein
MQMVFYLFFLKQKLQMAKTRGTDNIIKKNIKTKGWNPRKSRD